MSETFRKVLILSVFALTVWLVGPTAWKQFKSLWRAVPALYAEVAESTIEQRRLKVYGDCDGRGYGYVRRVLDGFPDQDSIPVVRYPDWDRHVELVLPSGRLRKDDRLVIGIELTETDMQETQVASAKLQTAERHDDGSVTSTWTFETHVDFEQMTGLVFAFASYPVTHAMVMKAVLQYAPYDTRVVGEWEVEVPKGQPDSLIVHLPRAVGRFSINRGDTSFVLKLGVRGVSAEAVPSPVGIDVLGVKVALADYVVIHREQNCFTAIQRRFLNEIQRAPAHPWSRYLERLRHEIGRAHV